MMANDVMTCGTCRKPARTHVSGLCHDCRRVKYAKAMRAVERGLRAERRLRARERRRMEAMELEAERAPDSFDPPDRPEF